MWALDPSKALNEFILVALATATVAMSCLVAQSIRKPVDVAFWTVMLTMTVNLVVVLLTPAGPIGHEGIYTHKNALVSTVAMGLLFCIYGMLRDQRYMKLVGALLLPACFFMLMQSESKTSFGLALLLPVLATVLVIGVHWFRVHLIIMLAMIVAFGWAVLALLNGVGITQEMMITAVFGDPTFTGRTELWTFALKHIPSHLWFGHGFFSFWRAPGSPQLLMPDGFLQNAPTGHNGYLDLLLHLGVVGFAIFIALLLAVAGQISRLAGRLPGVGFTFIAFFLFYVLINFLESTWFESLDDPSWALFAFIIFSPLAQRHENVEVRL